MSAKYAAFDLDKTLIQNNSSFAFCKYLCSCHFLSTSDLLFAATLYFRHVYLGLPLVDLHMRAFNRIFKGRPLKEIANYVFDFASGKFNYYTPVLVRLLELKQEGAEVAVFSSSPSFLVRALVRPLGIDAVFATEYETDEKGALTKLSYLMDGKNKAKALKEASQGKKTYAFSDSMIDIEFLEAADVPIAVRPSRDLRKLAKSKGWEILES